MQITLGIGAKNYRVKPGGHDLSIPLVFNGPQPNTYGVPAASAKAYEGGGFVGDTQRGGSCNFEIYTFVPHCNGTHTECVGHISKERIQIREVLQESFLPATLISLYPRLGSETRDTYWPNISASDKVIDRAALEKALEKVDSSFLTALLIRSLPNDSSKKSRDYMEEVPPYFTIEAMEYLMQAGVKHLLVDMPSVDRLFDEGKLSAHHVLWNVPQGSKEVDPERASANTITEFIFVSDEIEDGSYLLNLQVAPFMADAAPSRPIIYDLEQII